MSGEEVGAGFCQKGGGVCGDEIVERFFWQRWLDMGSRRKERGVLLQAL